MIPSLPHSNQILENTLVVDMTKESDRFQTQLKQYNPILNYVLKLWE